MRARSIKPGTFKNERLAEADHATRLLFIGLWMMADREGRLEDRPRRIKAEIMPYDDAPDITRALATLERLGFITRYLADDVAVIEVVNFTKHQNPHRNEKASELPSRPETRMNRASQEDSRNDASVSDHVAKRTDTLGLTPDSGLLTPDSGLRTPERGIPEPAEADEPAPEASSSSSSEGVPTEPTDYLRHLVLAHGYDEMRTRSAQSSIAQARQWHADEVTIAEIDAVVYGSRQQLAAKGDMHDPPVGYLAKVLAGNRRAAVPVAAGAARGTAARSDALDYGERLARMFGQDGADADTVATQLRPLAIGGRS